MNCSIIQLGVGATPATPATPPFNPGSLSPLVWLRSDLGISTVSGAVSVWVDQSVHGYNVTQGTGSNRPAYSASGGVNGLPKLTFGENSSVELQNTSFIHSPVPTEYFVVCSPNSPPSGNTVLLDLGGLNDALFVQSSGPQIEATQYNGAGLTNLTDLSTGTVCVIDAYFSGSTADFIALNGGTPTSGQNAGSSAQAGTNLTVGAGAGEASFLGDIYEVVILSAEASSAQRASLMAYFSARYGIIT